jgi:hypothetical protein
MAGVHEAGLAMFSANKQRRPDVLDGGGQGGAMESLVRDIKLGVRSFLRDKGFAATVVLTLAICIAAYTATFAIVHSVLLRPLPGPNADAIVLMSNQYPKAGVTDQSVSSVADYYDRLRVVTALEEQARKHSSVNRWTGRSKRPRRFFSPQRAGASE